MTGDKGYLDEKGDLFILDRYSRFAKLAGEMVSLMAVEDAMKALFEHNEDYEFLAVATPTLATFLVPAIPAFATFPATFCVAVAPPSSLAT